MENEYHYLSDKGIKFPEKPLSETLPIWPEISTERRNQAMEHEEMRMETYVRKNVQGKWWLILVRGSALATKEASQTVELSLISGIIRDATLALHLHKVETQEYSTYLREWTVFIDDNQESEVERLTKTVL